MIAFDIETIPNEAMIEHLPEPEVKLGNIKDIEKIKAKAAEAKQKQIDSMALNPFYGRICSAAFYDPDDYQGYKTIDEISDAAELELLDYIFDRLKFTETTSPTIITWCGMSFDLPFVYTRAALLNYRLSPEAPGLQYWIKRYTHSPHCDIERILSNWGVKSFRLDEVANAFLGDSKLNHDFSKFIELIKCGKGHEIGIYNLKDAELTYKLYDKLSAYLF
jgi:predicted PolB exonuclease-like 3'-5' exonuclease